MRANGLLAIAPTFAELSRASISKTFQFGLRNQRALADLDDADGPRLDQLIEFSQGNREQIRGIWPRMQDARHGLPPIFWIEKRRGLQAVEEELVPTRCLFIL